AEDQLTAMYDPVVQLKSGGYLVINPTEALVSIDINSGRSTKEHGIEATALKTNMEAAAEIARQLRLRDMAGLVVIDFIDMEYGANVRKVEKCMKDALRNDRARIQIGRISGFGLMEMSRQRLRTGVLEATTRGCPHCDGTGLVRTASSAGLSALRMIEDEAAKGKGMVISLFASQEAAVYLLNAKRLDLGAIEELYGVRVEVLPEGENEGAKMRVASSGPRPTHVPTFAPIAEPEADDLDDEEIDTAEDEEQDDREDRDEDGDGERSERGGGDRDRNKRRRRRGGRGRERGDERGEETPRALAADDAGDEGEPTGAAEPAGEAAEGEDDGSDGPRKRRRRSRRRRGGRGRSEGEAGEAGEEGEALDGEAVEGDAVAAVAEQLADDIAVVADPEAPAKPKRRSRARKADVEAVEAPAEAVAESVAEAEAEAPAKPARRSRRKAEPAAELEAEVPVKVEAVEPEAAEAAPARKPRARKAAAAKADTAPETATQPDPEAATLEPAGQDNPDEPRRGGWWQRTFG
ncbi:MAG: ribonuclease E/G, partial [Sphingomicrobium sp.]